MQGCCWGPSAPAQLLRPQGHRVLRGTVWVLWGSLGSPPGPQAGGSTSLVRRRRMGAPRCPAAGPQAGRMRWHQAPAHRDVPTAMGSISGASSLCWSPWSCPFQGDLGDRGQSSGGTRGFAGGSSMKNTKGKGCWVPHPALGDAGHRHSSAGGTWGCSAPASSVPWKVCTM